MKFDVSKLKELNELDFEQIAIWPHEVRIVVAAFVAILVGALSYYLLVSPKLPIQDAAELKEQELKLQFEAKYRIAANLDAYEAQLKQIREDFSSMLKSLPTSNETPLPPEVRGRFHHGQLIWSQPVFDKKFVTA